jgi:hypothetical protein
LHTGPPLDPVSCRLTALIGLKLIKVWIAFFKRKIDDSDRMIEEVADGAKT